VDKGGGGKDDDHGGTLPGAGGKGGGGGGGGGYSAKDKAFTALLDKCDKMSCAKCLISRECAWCGNMMECVPAKSGKLVPTERESKNGVTDSVDVCGPNFAGQCSGKQQESGETCFSSSFHCSCAATGANLLLLQRSRC